MHINEYQKKKMKNNSVDFSVGDLQITGNVTSWLDMFFNVITVRYR